MSKHKDPEWQQAIAVMARTPIYFGSGKIAFERDGVVNVYFDDVLSAEAQIEADDASAVALEFWRAINRVPEAILENMMQSLQRAIDEPGEEHFLSSAVLQVIRNLAEAGGYKGIRRGAHGRRG